VPVLFRSRGAGAVVSGLLLALGAAVGLGFGTVHATGARDALQTPAAVASARLDVAYYDCLTTQAHSLLRPGEAVSIHGDPTAPLVTLTKVVGGWVDLVPAGEPVPRHLDLVATHGRNGCLGTVVVLTSTGPGGHRTTVVGRGASVPGHRSPPFPAL
jgi:hypothetical protein